MDVDKLGTIELIYAYERMASWPDKTYDRATGLAKVKQGRKFVYIMPYGEDYECEGGHFVKILNQTEFDHLYSLTRMD